MNKGLLTIMLVLGLLPLISGCGTKSKTVEANPTPKADLTKTYLRSNSGGGVEIDVLWVTPENARSGGNDWQQFGPENNLVFYVSMTTHAGDLLSYDMIKGTVLRTGDLEVSPSTWQLLNEDGHHPEGVLVFPRQTTSSKEFPPAGTKTLSLTIRNLSDVDARTLTWEIP